MKKKLKTVLDTRGSFLLLVDQKNQIIMSVIFSARHNKKHCLINMHLNFIRTKCVEFQLHFTLQTAYVDFEKGYIFYRTHKIQFKKILISMRIKWLRKIQDLKTFLLVAIFNNI